MKRLLKNGGIILILPFAKVSKISFWIQLIEFIMWYHAKYIILNLFYIHLGYGMSETTLLVGNFMGMKVKPGSMGKPGPGYKVDIIDDLGKY